MADNEGAYNRLATKIAEKLASENPGLLVGRRMCDERSSAIMEHVGAIKGVVEHIRRISVIELVAVVVVLAGMVVTVLTVVLKE